jgi:hypothetical protein
MSLNGSLGPWKADGAADMETDDDDDGAVSAAVAGVLSSCIEQQHTNSVSFLPVLRDNDLHSGELPLLNALIFPSPQCYMERVLTLTKEDATGISCSAS